MTTIQILEAVSLGKQEPSEDGMLISQVETVLPKVKKTKVKAPKESTSNFAVIQIDSDSDDDVVVVSINLPKPGPGNAVPTGPPAVSQSGRPALPPTPAQGGRPSTYPVPTQGARHGLSQGRGARPPVPTGQVAQMYPSQVLQNGVGQYRPTVMNVRIPMVRGAYTAPQNGVSPRYAPMVRHQGEYRPIRSISQALNQGQYIPNHLPVQAQNGTAYPPQATYSLQTGQDVHMGVHPRSVLRGRLPAVSGPGYVAVRGGIIAGVGGQAVYNGHQPPVQQVYMGQAQSPTTLRYAQYRPRMQMQRPQWNGQYPYGRPNPQVRGFVINSSGQQQFPSPNATVVGYTPRMNSNLPGSPNSQGGAPEDRLQSRNDVSAPTPGPERLRSPPPYDKRNYSRTPGTQNGEYTMIARKYQNGGGVTSTSQEHLPPGPSVLHVNTQLPNSNQTIKSYLEENLSLNTEMQFDASRFRQGPHKPISPRKGPRPGQMSVRRGLGPRYMHSPRGRPASRMAITRETLRKLPLDKIAMVVDKHGNQVLEGISIDEITEKGLSVWRTPRNLKTTPRKRPLVQYKQPLTQLDQVVEISSDSEDEEGRRDVKVAVNRDQSGFMATLGLCPKEKAFRTRPLKKDVVNSLKVHRVIKAYVLNYRVPLANSICIYMYVVSKGIMEPKQFAIKKSAPKKPKKKQARTKYTRVKQKRPTAFNEITGSAVDRKDSGSDTEIDEPNEQETMEPTTQVREVERIHDASRMREGFLEQLKKFEEMGIWTSYSNRQTKKELAVPSVSCASRASLSTPVVERFCFHCTFSCYNMYSLRRHLRESHGVDR